MIFLVLFRGIGVDRKVGWGSIRSGADSGQKWPYQMATNAEKSSNYDLFGFVQRHRSEPKRGH